MSSAREIGLTLAWLSLATGVTTLVGSGCSSGGSTSPSSSPRDTGGDGPDVSAGAGAREAGVGGGDSGSGGQSSSHDSAGNSAAGDPAEMGGMGGANLGAACADGTWSKDSNPATPCVAATECLPGTFVEVEPSPGSDRICGECEAGTYTSKTNEASCADWSVCEAGHYVAKAGSATQDRTCSSCLPGEYSVAENVSSCTPCPGGQVAVGAGNTKCETCPAGTFASDKISCVDCRPGFYAPEPASGECKKCDPGAWSLSGESKCRNIVSLTSDYDLVIGIKAKVNGNYLTDTAGDTGKFLAPWATSRSTAKTESFTFRHLDHQLEAVDNGKRIITWLVDYTNQPQRWVLRASDQAAATEFSFVPLGGSDFALQEQVNNKPYVTAEDGGGWFMITGRATTIGDWERFQMDVQECDKDADCTFGGACSQELRLCVGK